MNRNRLWLQAIGAGGALAAGAARLDPGPALPALVVAAGIAGGMAVWDLYTHRLPNRALVTGVGTCGLALLFAGGTYLSSALIGAGIGWAVFLSLAMARPGALGFGDVKLAAFLAAHLALFDWHTVATGLALPFVFAAVIGAARFATGRTRLGAPMAFGPSLVLGAAAATCWAM